MGAKQSTTNEREPRGDLVKELKWLTISDNTVQESEIESYVKGLLSDMDLSSSIERQRTTASLGEILRNPLPLAHTREIPCLHPFFLRYEGESSKQLHRRLTVSSIEGGQPDQCVVFAQASGSGKTKQAYNLSQNGLPVILIRVAQPDLKQQHVLTKPWQEALSLLRRLEGATRELHPSYHHTVAKSALQVLRILIGAHLEWVAKILEEAKILRPNLTAENLRELAMRCLRNGEGETHVTDLFLRAMQNCKLQPENLGSVNFLSLPSSESKNYLGKVTSRVLQNLQSGPELVLFFDEVQAIMNHTTSLFVRLTDYGREGDVAKSDFYYGLCCLISDMMSSTFRFVLSGTHFGITEMTITLGCSPLRDKAAPCYVFDSVTAANIVSSLDFYLNMGAAGPVKSGPLTFKIASKNDRRFAAAVSRLCGRPVFFFECGWNLIFQRLSSLTTSPKSREELLTIVTECLEKAAGDKLKTMINIVQKQWQSRDTHDGIAVKTLPRDLYYAARMRKGIISLDTVKSTIRHAMAAGLLSIDPSNILHTVDLSTEPLLAEAVTYVGDEYVKLNMKTGGSGRGDPIYAYLVDRLSGFDPQERLNNKGPVFEEALTWHMVRMSLFAGKKSLGSVFASLFPEMFDVGDEIEQWKLSASSVVEVIHAAEFNDDASFLQFVGSGTVLRGIEIKSGLDLAADLTHHNGKRSLLAVQAKAQESVGFSHALVVTSPQAQYTRNDDRTKLLKGETLDDESFTANQRRVTFERIFKEKFALQPSWVRVVAATNGYSQNAVSEINKYNKKHRDTPIMLLCSTTSAFGSDLHKLLCESNAKPLNSVNGDHLRYLAFDAILTSDGGDDDEDESEDDEEDVDEDDVDEDDVDEDDV